MVEMKVIAMIRQRTVTFDKRTHVSSAFALIRLKIVLLSKHSNSFFTLVKIIIWQGFLNCKREGFNISIC